MKPYRAWIVEVTVTPEIEDKLAAKHGVRLEEVRQAVTLGSYAVARWHTHPRYGERLIVRGRTDDDVELQVILRPVDEADGIWECLTARRWR